MRLYNLLASIYFLPLIKQSVINSSVDLSKILSPLSYSILQLTSGIGSADNSQSGLESEFKRLCAIGCGGENAKTTRVGTESNGVNQMVTYSHLELINLKSSTKDPFKRLEKSYQKLLKHPVNEECVSSVFLILKVCISELGLQSAICKVIKKNFKIVKKYEKNYKSVRSKYTAHYKDSVSALFTLNSLLNLKSEYIEFNKSFVQELEGFLNELILFLERTASFVALIEKIFMKFCSPGGLTYYTNMVDQTIKESK
ncbi:uncharacterized protein ELE39_000569 [Cryptosporidium sp. chipmunk genotype I]|uniref:uncharacterized protein n=1 Tax=Cryptosporidium sp. chipmunk genotype I TaxID=1280935 RepID=UPI00351AAAEB|nr:hypothetical protein ELE39_000569 [Cryptosporidium sp. chipmunk genotype I]